MQKRAAAAPTNSARPPDRFKSNFFPHSFRSRAPVSAWNQMVLFPMRSRHAGARLQSLLAFDDTASVRISEEKSLSVLPFAVLSEADVPEVPVEDEKVLPAGSVRKSWRSAAEIWRSISSVPATSSLFSVRTSCRSVSSSISASERITLFI